MQKVCILSAEDKERICEHCASNLRIMRTYLGWKQGELAAAVGTTHRRISEIETGRSKLPWTLYLALALVFEKNKKTRNSPVFETIVTDEVIRFISGKHQK